MKNIKHLLTILILLSSISVFGQIEKDSTIINYIKVQSEYVELNDLNRIPDNIRPYLSSVKEYMNKNKMPLNEYWIWTSYIKEDSNSLSIPICHYNGFVFKKELEEKDKKANENKKPGEPLRVTDFVGNASGKDGNLEIDKNTKIVLSFKLWE
jgi:hypothetical protein